MTLHTQLVLLQTLIVLIVIVSTGVTVAWTQERQLRDDYLDRMKGVALSTASMSAILEAYDDEDPAATIQPIAETIAQASDVTYVVLTDINGIRYSHPDPTEIGKKVSTPPQALDGDLVCGDQVGTLWCGTEKGTLGWSWRVKAPVIDDNGQLLGQVSIGVLESTLREEYVQNIGILGLLLAAAAVVGVLLATGAATIVRRSVYGVEPEEIKAMLDMRDATLHGIADGIIVLDQSGKIVLSNDAARRLLGSASSSPDGLDISDVLRVDLDSLLAEKGSKQTALAGERVLLASAAPIIVSGKPQGSVVILLDRTEIDAAVRELQGAQSMTETLRSHHHEFRNTLHTLGGLIELGEYEAAHHLIERAGGALSPAPADEGIGDIEVAAFILAKRSYARERGITLATSPGSTLSPSDDQSSADRITVLGNLIDNALDAAGEGGTIALALQEQDGTLTITVEDDGPGIPTAEREAILRLGYSSKGETSQLPRGYGLTLVSRVVERLGGAITIGDSVLGGAKITVSLEIPTTSPIPTETRI